jgi:hypothetical protein
MVHRLIRIRWWEPEFRQPRGRVRRVEPLLLLLRFGSGWRPECQVTLQGAPVFRRAHRLRSPPLRRSLHFPIRRNDQQPPCRRVLVQDVFYQVIGGKPAAETHRDVDVTDLLSQVGCWLGTIEDNVNPLPDTLRPPSQGVTQHKTAVQPLGILNRSHRMQQVVAIDQNRQAVGPIPTVPQSAWASIGTSPISEFTILTRHAADTPARFSYRPRSKTSLSAK